MALVWSDYWITTFLLSSNLDMVRIIESRVLSSFGADLKIRTYRSIAHSLLILSMRMEFGKRL